MHNGSSDDGGSGNECIYCKIDMFTYSSDSYSAEDHTKSKGGRHVLGGVSEDLLASRQPGLLAPNVRRSTYLLIAHYWHVHEYC